MVKKYEHLFFDLDHTLWDFEKNSTTTLMELYDFFNLKEKGIEHVSDFIRVYQRINDALWSAYRHGAIDKETLRSRRFYETFRTFGLKDKALSISSGDYYVHHSPRKTFLFPNTHETLSYLKEKYVLHIITNGFEEVQHLKLDQCKLKDYFTEVITSERAGCKKPDAAIFTFSMKLVNAFKNKSLMIGDNYEVDVLGAKGAGLDQVFFNPKQSKNGKNATFEIKDIAELKLYL